METCNLCGKGIEGIDNWTKIVREEEIVHVECSRKEIFEEIK